MNSTRLIAFGLAGVLPLLLGLAVWQRVSLGEMQAHTRGLETQRRSLVARNDANSHAIAAARSEIKRLGPELSSVREAEAAAEANLKEQERARVKTIHAWLALRNGPLYRKLGLTPGQIETLDRLAVDRWLRVQDINATGVADGLAPTDPSLVALRRQEAANFNQSVAALLGPAIAESVQQYDRLGAALSVTNIVAGNLAYSNTPLTAAQAEQFVQISANTSASHRAGGTVGTDMNATDVVAQSRNVLLPEQIAAVEGYSSGERALHQLLRLFNPQSAAAPVSTAAQASAK